MKKKSKFLLGMSIASCLCLSLGALSACGDEEAVFSPEADNQIQTIYNAYAAQAGENALSYEEWLETIQGAVGEKGDKGDKGDQGEAGKSAYEIAVENGFVGTEADWLESLKGEDGKDANAGHTHTFGAKTQILEASATAVGVSYAKCSCGEAQFFPIEHVQLTEGKVTTVPNYGKMFFRMALPAATEDNPVQGKAFIKIMDKNGEIIPADRYTLEYKGEGFNGDEYEDFYYDMDSREYVQDVTKNDVEVQATVKFANAYTKQYAEYQVQPFFAVDGVEYENTVVLNVKDGANCGVTKIKTSYVDNSDLLNPVTKNIEADVVNGKATFMAPTRNASGQDIVLQLELVGLDTENFLVDSEALTFTRPADGSGDKGCEYTISVGQYETYIITVLKTDGTPAANATVELYKATDMRKWGFSWMTGGYTAKDPIYESEASIVIETDQNGEATVKLAPFTVTSNELTEDGNNTVDTTVTGVFYQAKVVGDFGFGGIAPDAITLGTNKFPTMKALYAPTIIALDTSIRIPGTSTATKMFLATEETLEAGDYTFELTNWNFGTPSLNVNGTDVEWDSNYVAKITLNAGENQIMVTNSEAGFGNATLTKWVDPEQGGDEDPETPVGTKVTLGANTLDDQKDYYFTATEAGTYTFTIENTTVEMYPDQESAYATNYEELVINIFDAPFGSGVWTKDFAANETFNFFIYITGSGYTADLTITKDGEQGGGEQGGETTGTVVTLGDTLVEYGKVYSFTATEAGTYIFSCPIESGTQLWTEEDYNNSTYDYSLEPLAEFSNWGVETYARTMAANETLNFICAVMNGNETTLTIEKEQPAGPVVPENAKELTLGQISKTLAKSDVVYFTATEAGTYTFTTTNKMSLTMTFKVYGTDNVVYEGNLNGDTFQVTLGAGETVIYDFAWQGVYGTCFVTVTKA